MNQVGRHVPAGLLQVVAPTLFVTAARNSANQGNDSGLGEQNDRDVVLFVQSGEHLQDFGCTGDVAAIHPQQLHQPELSKEQP